MAFQDGRWLPVNDPMWDQADESCYLAHLADGRLAVIGATYGSRDEITGSRVIEVAPPAQQYGVRCARWVSTSSWRKQSRAMALYHELQHDEQARRLSIIRYKLGTATPVEALAVQWILDPEPF